MHIIYFMGTFTSWMAMSVPTLVCIHLVNEPQSSPIGTRNWENYHFLNLPQFSLEQFCNNTEYARIGLM